MAKKTRARSGETGIDRSMAYALIDAWLSNAHYKARYPGGGIYRLGSAVGKIYTFTFAEQKYIARRELGI